MSFAYNPQSTGDEITAAKFNAVTAAQGRIDNIGLYPAQAGSYHIFEVSSVYYRRDGLSGLVDDSNAVLLTIVQDANDALTSGGLIYLHEVQEPGIVRSANVMIIEDYQGVRTVYPVAGGSGFKLQPYYTIYKTGSTWYAMDADGGIDYSGANGLTVMNNALTAAAGYSVFLTSNDTLVIDDMIDIPSATWLYGDGRSLIQLDANVIVSNSNFGCIRFNGVNNSYVGHLRIDGNQANNAGSLPHVAGDEGNGVWITAGAYNNIVDHVEIFECMERGVRISHGAPYNNRTWFCYAHDNGMLGVMNGDGFMYGASGYRNMMHGCIAANSWKDNFIFFNQDRSTISNNLSYDPGQIGAGGGGTHYALDGTATLNLLMDNYGYNTNAAQSVGILVGATANFNSVIGNVIEAGSLYGVDVRGDYNTIGGNVVTEMDYTGFRFLNATYNTIWGNYSLNNNQSTQVALESGFYFNNSDYNLIGFNWGIDTQGGGATQLYGLNFNATSSDNVVGFNGATGNVTSDWQVTGSNPQCFFNLGYVNFNRGAAANVVDGGNIAHGLSGTPTNVRCTPSVASEMVSVTALGAANFTVAIKTDAGAVGTQQTIYWDAWL